MAVQMEPQPGPPVDAGVEQGVPSPRRAAALAGHQRDEPLARRLGGDPDPAVRATALGALARMERLTDADLLAALVDPDAVVRHRAAELAATRPGVPLDGALSDADPKVVEAAAWAAGEREDPSFVALLDTVARTHADPLCREAAVAALGAIGADAGLPAVLAATGDKPAVRRRAVIALAAFEGPDVDAALQRALTDPDRQVRQAAEDLLAP
jgi:HEAT repeat protein